MDVGRGGDDSGLAGINEVDQANGRTRTTAHDGAAPDSFAVAVTIDRLRLLVHGPTDGAAGGRARRRAWMTPARPPPLSTRYLPQPGVSALKPNVNPPVVTITLAVH